MATVSWNFSLLLPPAKTDELGVDFGKVQELTGLDGGFREGRGFR